METDGAQVITLLEKLQGEIEEEGKSEAAAYDKSCCFLRMGRAA